MALTLIELPAGIVDPGRAANLPVLAGSNKLIPDRPSSRLAGMRRGSFAAASFGRCRRAELHDTIPASSGMILGADT
jgi:hypothetical protein